MILTYAAADAIGVLLYYSFNIPLIFATMYFTLYTFLLISSVTFIWNNETITDKIKRMKKEGMKQSEIATNLGVSEAKISRELNK